MGELFIINEDVHQFIVHCFIPKDPWSLPHKNSLIAVFGFKEKLSNFYFLCVLQRISKIRARTTYNLKRKGQSISSQASICLYVMIWEKWDSLSCYLRQTVWLILPVPINILVCRSNIFRTYFLVIIMFSKIIIKGRYIGV